MIKKIKNYHNQEGDLLKALEFVSEQLAKWSLNDGPLTNLPNETQHELERLEVILENTIVPAGGKW